MMKSNTILKHGQGNQYIFFPNNPKQNVHNFFSYFRGAIQITL
jgi:hypothetical protein